jgi:kynureninase
VVERAHQVGALVLLDTYQSAGTVPVDLAALGVDLAVGGSVKWLLGGPGTGYLYARPGVAERLSPRLLGWFGHDAPLAFEPAPIRFAAGAARFATGTPNVAAHAMAAEGFRIVTEVGVEAIRAKSQRQTAASWTASWPRERWCAARPTCAAAAAAWWSTSTARPRPPSS